MDDEDSSVRTALQRGAVGYLLKDASATELHRALTGGAEGQFSLSSSLLECRVSWGVGKTTRPARTVRSLTPRERSIVELLAKGRSNDDIARSFGVSSKTVRNQLSLLYTKLAVTDRSQAVLLARDLGFG